MYDFRKPLPVFDAAAGIAVNAEVLYTALEMVPGFILRRYWKFSTSRKTNYSQRPDVNDTVQLLVLLLHFFEEIKEYPGVDTASLKQLLQDYCFADVVADPMHVMSKHASRLLVSKDMYFQLWTTDQKPGPHNNYTW